MEIEEAAAAAVTDRVGGSDLHVEAGGYSTEWTRLFNQALRLYRVSSSEYVGTETKSLMRYIKESATQGAKVTSSACPAATGEEIDDARDKFLIAKRLVWVKIRGYPWWPALKVRLEDVPKKYREGIPDAKAAGNKLVYTFGDHQFAWVKSKSDTMRDWQEYYTGHYSCP